MPPTASSPPCTPWLCGYCPEAFPNFCRVVAPNGKLPGAGEILKNPELAATYRRLAAEGIDDFYRGSVAREMVAYMREHGGLWSEHDLAEYKVKWLRPLRATYGEMEVDGSPPSASSLTWMHAAYFNKQCPGMACDPVEWSRSGRRASRSWEHAW